MSELCLALASMSGQWIRRWNSGDGGFALPPGRCSHNWDTPSSWVATSLTHSVCIWMSGPKGPRRESGLQGKWVQVIVTWKGKGKWGAHVPVDEQWGSPSLRSSSISGSTLPLGLCHLVLWSDFCKSDQGGRGRKTQCP